MDDLRNIQLLVDTRLYAEAMSTLLRAEAWVSGVSTSLSLNEFAMTTTWCDDSVVLVNCSPELQYDWIHFAVTLPHHPTVVALGVAGTEDEVIRCAQAGASGYFFRDQSIAELEDTVEAALRGEAICPPMVTALLMRWIERVAGQVQSYGTIDGLTGRELEVLSSVASGRSNKEIASELCIGLATVKNHVHSILQKLEVSRRGEAAALFRQNSLSNTAR